MEITDIEKHGTLGYKFLRGSWSHGIAIEGVSDYDYGGVYITPLERLFGLRENYKEQVSDDKHDETYYELGRWIELILKQNPTALESLFIDPKFVIGEVHPAVQVILDHKQEFISKECFNPLLRYSFEQIRKATGYHKKCHIPEDFQRKGPLDFCYTFHRQGSTPLQSWLDEHDLNQKFCGLVNVPNMPLMYGLYYDFAAHEKFGGGLSVKTKKFMLSNGLLPWKAKLKAKNKEFSGYIGIVNPDNEHESFDIRLSSVLKGEKPLCFVNYNKDAYSTHCRQYKEWVEWKTKRNKARFDMNKGYNFDAKNMCETVRLIHTGIELARDGVFNVERTWDRDFLLSIKQHKMTYEEIMAYANEKKAEFDSLVEKCTLPDTIDKTKVENILIEARKQLYLS